MDIEILKKLESEFDQRSNELKSAISPQEVEQLRLDYLGRKGHFPKLMMGLRDAKKEDRPMLGKEINVLKAKVEKAIAILKSKAEDHAIDSSLACEPLDFSLPVQTEGECGSLHPVTLITQELMNIFRKLGYIVFDGPEIEFDFYNFSALNIAKDHPARAMQDTFYVDSGEPQEPWYLRTHTSNVQIHAMKNLRPPLKLIAPGRTFRVDNDPTHSPMFHQIEGLVVDEGISFGDLKGALNDWVKALFGPQATTRVRPSYFPFVEPGAEMDMNCVACFGKDSKCRVCKGSGWLEIGGCGMVHPNVFEAVGYDSERYTGFAFGFGIDRMAMLKYGLDDLRIFFNTDPKFLKQFPIYPNSSN